MIINCPECGHQVSDRAKVCPSCGIEIAGKKKGSAGYVVLAIAVVIALVIVLLGVYYYKTQERQNEQRAYENALSSDEQAVLQNFLDVYAEAPRAHRDSIMSHLSRLKQIDLDWANALMSGSKQQLQQYMKRYPHSVHNVEALLQIDSLDWVAAQRQDTPESYQAYIDAHYDGAHYDEARAAFERLDAQQVKPEDKDMIAQLFRQYYQALAESNESQLTATLENILTSFLHKEQATKGDVLQYMTRLHEADITRIVYTLNNDWEIEKRETEPGVYAYSVAFSVDQQLERTDPSKERFCTYKVQAQVSPEVKISELNMKKIVR